MEVAHLDTKSTRRSQVQPPRALCPSQEKPLSRRGRPKSCEWAPGATRSPAADGPPPAFCLRVRRGHGRAGSGHPGTWLASVPGKPGGGGQAPQTALLQLTPAKRLCFHACWPCTRSGVRPAVSTAPLECLSPGSCLVTPQPPGTWIFPKPLCLHGLSVTLSHTCAEVEQVMGH